MLLPTNTMVNLKLFCVATLNENGVPVPALIPRHLICYDNFKVITSNDNGVIQSIASILNKCRGKKMTGNSYESIMKWAMMVTLYILQNIPKSDIALWT